MSIASLNASMFVCIQFDVFSLELVLIESEYRIDFGIELLCIVHKLINRSFTRLMRPMSEG